MQRFLWLAFAVFLAFLACSAGALVFFRLRAGADAPGYILFVVLPSIVIGAILLLFLRRRPIVYLYSLALAVGCYGAQEYLLRQDRQRPSDKFAAVIQARQRGIDAVPSLHPLDFTWRPQFSVPAIAGRPMLPLAGISKTLTYYCQEAGPFLIYPSDRYGFNNPDGVWDGPVDIAFIGDSFTQGACVPAEEHFSGILRRAVPRLLNLGIGGNGPLAALATLQEYLAIKQPATVFWVYFEGNDVFVRAESREKQGDVGNIETEFTLPLLRTYLSDPGFRQGLPEHQAAIDSALRRIVQIATEEEIQRRSERSTAATLESIAARFTLAPLAKRLFANLPERTRTSARNVNARLVNATADRQNYAVKDGSRVDEGVSATESVERLRAVLEQMKARVARWDAKLMLIYLPDIDHFRFGPHPIREEVLSLAQDLGIQAIDMVPIFDGQADAFDLFALGGRGGHYSALGYGLIGQAIAHSSGIIDPEPRRR